MARAARAILSVLPIDDFEPGPVRRMEVVGAPGEVPPIQREVQAELERAAPGIARALADAIGAGHAVGAALSEAARDATGAATGMLYETAALGLAEDFLAGLVTDADGVVLTAGGRPSTALAKRAGTINYEVVCAPRGRTTRTYIGEGK